MSTTQAPHPCTHTIACLAEQVAAYPAEDVGMAIRILTRIGPPAVEFLLAAAARLSMPVIGTCRLLDLARWIGGERGPKEDRHFRVLRQHWSPTIRFEAERLYAVLWPFRQSGQQILHNRGVPRRPMTRATTAARFGQ